MVVCSILLFIVLWSILGPSLIQNFLGRLVGFAFTLPTIYFGYNLAAKRFNDRDRPIICAQDGRRCRCRQSASQSVPHHR